MNNRICPACNGSGLDVNDAPCTKCRGIGEIDSEPVRVDCGFDCDPPRNCAVCERRPRRAM